MRGARLLAAGLLAPSLLLPACEAPDEPNEVPIVTVDPGPAFTLGDEQPCESPTSGWSRFTEVGVERGLTEIAVDEDTDDYPVLGFETMVVAEDVDLDGDIDLLIAGASWLPTVWLNDGTAHFTKGPAIPPGPVDEPDLFGLADLDGNRLPDLVGNQFYGGAWVALNLGEGAFSEITHVPPGIPGKAPATGIALGDVDFDGDVDAVVSGGAEDHNSVDVPPTVLLTNEAGELTATGTLNEGFGVNAIGTTFTDRDWDGVPEILQVTGTDSPGLPNAWWAYDGGWSDIAPELGVDLNLAGMGVAVTDLNDDGFMDFCGSDVGAPLCMQSLPDGTYVEVGQALGIEPAERFDEQWSTLGWAMRFADLDADGETELLQASGYDRESWFRDLVGWPDLLWSRDQAGGGFTDVSAAAGFDLAEDHYGIAEADFDGDGWLDVATAGPLAPPRLFLNSCGAGGWLDVELLGATINASALGARVEVEAGGRVWKREVLGPKGSGQSPSRAHVGVGDFDAVDRLTIRWPDGQVTEATDLPTRRTVVARHPEFVR